jgi:hypothetical protein
MKSNHLSTQSGRNEIFPALIICLALYLCSFADAAWRPTEGPLATRWGKQVTPENVHGEYPRPQMIRKDWLNLNGLWEYAIRPKAQEQPEEFDGEILVPFPVESALSGVMKSVGPDNRLWYRRTFEVPDVWDNERILLHFGAVDWDATVWINGKEVGNHRGGYDPFTFDITDALKENGEQEIVLSVWDPTNAGTQPRGKQVRNPRGIWYTAVTGIWQTVWLEPVPQASIRSVKITPDLDEDCVWVQADATGAGVGATIVAAASFKLEGQPDSQPRLMRAHGPAGRRFRVNTPGYPRVKLWSPESPVLHDIDLRLYFGGEEHDHVDSYFGMRKIEVEKDHAGINRLFLNNEHLFQYGPLDQGWWPDGLYAAPSDEALRYDIEVLKELGCNMLRKHVKVEPNRFYYWCDKLGLMVWQDMPNGDRHIRGNDADLDRSEESAEQFELELTGVINAFRNHPSIVMWVPFNEGWGQYDTPRIVNLIEKLDPTRLVNNASGWADRGVGDVHDIHRYPGPAAPPVEEDRAAVLGEFGGLGLPVKGHTWQDKKNWGYRSYKTRDELTDAYVRLIDNLRSLIGDGLAAAVYTQTTDVEIEVNGLMTYDRAIIKMDAEKVAAANNRLYLPPPVIKTIVPTSQNQAQKWRYTTRKPDDGWQKPNFDDSAWQSGQGGFGTKGTPGAVVRTEWNGSDIWLRRTFNLRNTEPSRPQLSIHHDEDAEVYINGKLTAKLKGYTTSYTRVTLDEKTREALKAGSNCIAIHCRQTTGGQYIDAGLVDVIEQ